jgi:hypothetical protein
MHGLRQLEWMVIENDDIILGKRWTIKFDGNGEPVMLPLEEVVRNVKEMRRTLSG